MKKIRQISIGLLVTVSAIVLVGHHFENQYTQEEIAEKILRFHVIANSDSREDQELKLKVRDAVGLYMKKELENVKDKKEAEQKAALNLKEIEKIAKKTIENEGKSYPVNAMIAQVDFPVKTYGEYSFPAGTYEALEVVIGEGSGKNWWCVMYPNMCFQGSMYEVIDEKAETSLREVLTQEEYDSIIENGDYKIRFKYLTFLNRYF
jgi:stage II sporulation protein R